jgi:hypothetical protein
MKSRVYITVVFWISLAVTNGLGALGQSLADSSTTTKKTPLGLTVRADGVLLHENQPFRGIGVNYFNAFGRHLANPQDTSYREGFQELAKRKIPFVRLVGCGFWPADQKLYQENPEEFFRRFDDMVKSAEEFQIGLIPSLFWTPATVPDLVGEPLDQWGNTESKTQEYMRRYVHDVVTRYRNSPAIWGWEFGNEYNLAADLPSAAENRPAIVPNMGTPTTRSSRDDLTYAFIRTAFIAFAQEVRKYDATRMISTGNSAPRDSAWHNWKEKTWTVDTPEQFAEMLRDDNPDPASIVSIHSYVPVPSNFIPNTVELCRRFKKPLFIGEFGAGEITNEREQFLKLLAEIETAQVPLAALWVFDFIWQDTTYNITTTNARSYQLEAIAEANVRIRKALAAETK